VLVQSNAEQLRALTADLEAGRLRTRIAEVLPLAQAARAHELNEAGGLRGKVLLAP
jgi:NADPH:quinone reductase-like Zn-dependent oxidoreductase